MGQWVTQQESVVSGSKSLITRQENILLVSKAESSLIMRIFNGNFGVWKDLVEAVKNLLKQKCTGKFAKTPAPMLFRFHEKHVDNKCCLNIIHKIPQRWHDETHLPSPPKKTPGGIHWIHLTSKWIHQIPPDVLVWRLATLTSKSLTLALPSSSLSWAQDGNVRWYIGTVFLVQKSEESTGEVGSSSDYLQVFLFTSQVVQDFWTINSMSSVCDMCSLWMNT